MADGLQNVPKEFVRTADHHLLPPRVGHNWNDQAFRKNQDKPQQLEGELRGKRAFVFPKAFENPMPENLGESARQLMQALATKNPRSMSSKSGALSGAGGGLGGSSRSRGAGGAAAASRFDERYLSLDDKVLRFYAYFRERAPEGGANHFWHRRVVIKFYPVDNTILIEEPSIPNSGMSGGVFLKRQKALADPRQREQFPNDEYLTINFFNVGEVVRINATEFYLYDCDPFTREFLTTLGVVVGDPMECPDDEFMEEYKRQQKIILGAKFGVKSSDYQAEEAERTARFIRDGGKILRFKGLLDERESALGGVARKLELFVFVEDNSMAITEEATLAEATPAMFLSRCFLPKNGSLAKVNELTFSHRVNGQREPDVGPEGIYKDIDLDVGMTINVLGRPVFLYDCDEFTREFYQKRFGVALRPSMKDEVEAKYYPAKEAPHSAAAKAAKAAAQEPQKGSAAAGAAKPKEELRFRLVMVNPTDHGNGFRRFTLTYYTDTNEVTVYETTSRNRAGTGGSSGGQCLMKRQPMRKPVERRGPRNDPKEKLRASQNSTNNSTNGVFQSEAPEVYHEEDFRVGKVVVVCGEPMRITSMDAHTEAYFTGVQTVPPSEATVDRLLAELLDFLGSRFGTAVKAFLAFDHDRDGVISLEEFITSLKAFQITEDPALGEELFARITEAPYEAFYLTAKDLMRWMGESAGVPASSQDSASTDHDAADKADLPVGSKEEQLRSIAARGMRVRVLNDLRERLEARQMNSVGMFRLASTMPRAYKERRADVYTLFNPDRDAQITPVQLRRCCEEILSATLTQEEMSCIVSFFFPNMPEAEQFRARDNALDFAVDLPTFQKRYHDMCRLAMIPEKAKSSPAAAAEIKTSIL